jgi:hypothetical protein
VSADAGCIVFFFLQCFRITVNAASKGHLPVVMYLLNKQFANPLIRNNWGETAYDVAAAVFEIWICEVVSISSIFPFSLKSITGPAEGGSRSVAQDHGPL